MKAGGYLPDELGFSFYPSASSTPPDRSQAFKLTVMTVPAEFGRAVSVAEFCYPAEKVTGRPVLWNNSLEADPCTPKGQADLLRDLSIWGLANGLSGIRP